MSRLWTPAGDCINPSSLEEMSGNYSPAEQEALRVSSLGLGGRSRIPEGIRPDSGTNRHFPKRAERGSSAEPELDAKKLVGVTRT